MGTLDGRQVVVTGATGNVGREVCARIVAEGGRVWALDRSAEALAALAATLGPAVRGEVVDLGDPAAVEATLDAAGSTWGLVHTVGGWAGGGVGTTTADTFGRMVDLNLRTTLVIAHALLPRLIAGGGGRVVTFGSLAAARGVGLAGAAAYNATKAGVIALTVAMDEEGRGSDVRAVCLAPSTLDTPQNRAAMPDVDPSRWVPLDHVAEAAVACLSPTSGVGGCVLTLPGRD